MSRLVSSLLIAAGAAGVGSTAAAQPPDPAPPSTPPPLVEYPSETPIEATTPSTAVASPGLVPIPAGCPVPPTAELVFVGRLADHDTRTGRFEVQVVRAGSTGGFASGNLIDVRYGIDAKYLDIGRQYLVGAGVEDGLLYSKVRPNEPLFGGDEVVGAAEIDVECPPVEDPVRTLTVTGRSIESGVLQPLASDRTDLLRAIVLPLAAAFAILVGLATLRWLITGVVKGATSAASLTRSRRYRSGES